jgi:hypothetical protein
MGYLNSKFYLTSFFDEDKTIFFRNSSLDIYSTKVEDMLSNTVYYLTSLIPIHASMNFTPEVANHTISTLNDLIEVTISVIVGDGRFVKQIFSSVSI